MSESYPMNTNIAGFRWFFQNLCALVTSSISIGRVNRHALLTGYFHLARHFVHSRYEQSVNGLTDNL